MLPVKHAAVQWSTLVACRWLPAPFWAAVGRTAVAQLVRQIYQQPRSVERTVESVAAPSTAHCSLFVAIPLRATVFALHPHRTVSGAQRIASFFH